MNMDDIGWKFWAAFVGLTLQTVLEEATARRPPRGLLMPARKA